MAAVVEVAVVEAEVVEAAVVEAEVVEAAVVEAEVVEAEVVEAETEANSCPDWILLLSSRMLQSSWLPTHSRSESVDNHASQSSSVVKNEKMANKLSDDEEELMVAFLQENEMLCYKKATNYRRPDMKNAALQKQTETMSNELSHLQGWFKGMRDNFARLEKLPMSGSGPQIFRVRASFRPGSRASLYVVFCLVIFGPTLLSSSSNISGDMKFL